MNSFLQNIWNKKAVVLKSSPFAKGLISEDEIFECMIKYCDDPAPDAIRFFIDGKLHYGDIAQWYPKVSDQNLKKYLKRLDQDFLGQSYAFSLSALQTHMSFQYWNRIRDFLYPIVKKFGLPPGYLGCTVALFVGNYSKTPFGLHRDPESTFCLPIVGKKMIRVWPKKVLKDKPQTYFLEHYSKLNPKSKLLKGKPGDILYWPSDYWHVGESDGSTMVSLHIAYSTEGSLQQSVSALLKQAIEQNLPEQTLFSLPYSKAIPVQFKKSLKKVKDIVATSLDERLEMFWWLRLSSLGFALTPRKRAVIKMTKNLVFCANSKYPVFIIQRKKEIELYSNGQLFVFLNVPFIVSLIADLNTGKPFVVNDLHQKYAKQKKHSFLINDILNDLYKSGAIEMA